jgi:hypothetical protein
MGPIKFAWRTQSNICPTTSSRTGMRQPVRETAFPALMATYRASLPPKFDTVKTDYTHDFEKYGVILEATEECLLFDRGEQFISELHTAARNLGRKIRGLWYEALSLDSRKVVSDITSGMDREGKTKLAEDCLREPTINPCWLENWPLTFCHGPPESDKPPVRMTMSIRGAWRWITTDEKTILEAGGAIARLMLPEPRLLPMDSVEWKPIGQCEPYPVLKRLGKTTERGG